MDTLTKNEFIAFAISAGLIIIFSRHVIFKPKSHGFYRFFGWIGVAWLFVNNYTYWFADFFSVYNIISWIFLLYATYIVIAGIILMKLKGKADGSRKDNSLYGFESTTELIETGLYKYIRHPLYGSLVFITWGIFFKHPEISLLVISVIATAAFFATMIIEEKENVAYFGEKYRSYMKRSKMIVPFLL
jgi:protein-S-isoprenylcysteine O-methyltransferase Ste14